MKLAVTLALVTVAFCCSPASSQFCMSFLDVTKTLFVGSLSEFEDKVALFSPDAEMREAAIEMKKLVDALLQQAKDSIMRRMVPGFPH